MRYKDTFEFRPFQHAVIESVLDGMASDRKETIVLASPGSGKTLAYQATATFLRREYGLEYVAIFVPRVILAQQCETSWMHHRRDVNGNLVHDQWGKPVHGGNHLLFDARDRFGMIRHIGTPKPLLPPGETGIGFVTTYSALATRPAHFTDWAAVHSGKFLLVADEAQFCGAQDEKNEGTRAGAYIRQLHEHSAHTLLLTGTPYRSDGNPLILAEYGDPVDGLKPLLSHAEATYADGVGEGYLREFEGLMHDCRVRWRQVDNTVIEYDLSASGADLVEVLRREAVYKGIADDVVAAVREKQRINPGYRGLISCMEQSDAKRVDRYLRGQHPGLRVRLAITEDGPDAERALRAFQKEPADVLVTVRKAFIGYDCPQITVVGILTHYRDKGHLMQLVGRGLRVWNEEKARRQSCRVIAPDDPRMQEFIEFMRGQSEQGLRERKQREEQGERSRSERTDDAQLGFVEDAHPHRKRAVGNDADVDNEELVLIEAIKHKHGSVEDVTILKKILEDYGFGMASSTPLPDPETAPSAGVPLTEREQVQRINAETQDEIKAYLADREITPAMATYGDVIAKVTAKVNTDAGCKAAQARTVEQAQARLDAARALRVGAR